MSAIKFENVCIKYRDFFGVYDLSFNLDFGQSVGIIFSSPDCAMLVLRALIDKWKIFSGNIEISNIPISKVNFKKDINIGYVGEIVLFENDSVEKNLKFFIKKRKNSAKNSDILQILQKFHYFQGVKTKVKELSAIDRLRLVFARLSLLPKDVLVVGDIFDGLMQQEREEVFAYINQYQTRLYVGINKEIANCICKSTVVTF